MPIKLTDALARGEPPPSAGNTIVRDSEAKGLGLRITAAGARVWVFEYETGGRSRRFTIGGLDAFTVGRARKVALDLKAKVRLGEDPQADRNEKRTEQRAEREAETPKIFADIVEDFLASLQKKGRASRYVEESRRLFVLHALPRWGTRSLAEIGRKDVIQVLDDIAVNGTSRKVDGKKFSAAGGPIAANRVLAATRGTLQLVDPAWPCGGQPLYAGGAPGA